MSWSDDGRAFAVLIGKTITAIENRGDEIIIACSDGTSYRQHHRQDCCESVSVEDVVGDFEDLIGSPILEAEEATSGDNPDGVDTSDLYQSESYTWTFYKLATIKGRVTIRWYGSSNGYYSEGVDFEEIT